MSFFSSKNNQTSKQDSSAIPPEIQQAVRIMGSIASEPEVHKAKWVSAASGAVTSKTSSSPSPFLGSSHQEVVLPEPFSVETHRKGIMDSHQVATPAMPTTASIPSVTRVPFLKKMSVVSGANEVNKTQVPENETLPKRPFAAHYSSSFQEFSQAIPKAENVRLPSGQIEFEGEHTQKKGRIFKAILLSAFLLMLTGAGVWYYWYFMKVPEKTMEPEPIPPESSFVTDSLPSIPELPFSLTSPNYLSFDTETVTPESFRILIQQAGDKLIAANITQPVEFLPTDKNNNPIAFSRFAYLMKIDLKPELIAAIQESFSLFLYNDHGKVFLGVNLMFMDNKGPSLLKAQKENSLPLAFLPLFYNGKILPKALIFSSSAYINQTVRFVNIFPMDGLSFDYIVQGNQWLIGSSKNTLRAMLDKFPSP